MIWRLDWRLQKDASREEFADGGLQCLQRQGWMLSACSSPRPTWAPPQTPLKRAPTSPASTRLIPHALQPNKKPQESQLPQGLNNRKTISRGIPDLILKLWQIHCSGKGQGSPKGAVSYLYSRSQVSPSLPPSPAEAAPPIYLLFLMTPL